MPNKVRMAVVVVLSGREVIATYVVKNVSEEQLGYAKRYAFDNYNFELVIHDPYTVYEVLGVDGLLDGVNILGDL